MGEMSEIKKTERPVGRIVFRSLMAACLTLSIAILWGEARSQNIQSVLHGLPLDAAIFSGRVLFVLAVFCLRRYGRLAVYGLLVSVWTLLVCHFMPSI